MTGRLPGVSITAGGSPGPSRSSSSSPPGSASPLVLSSSPWLPSWAWTAAPSPSSSRSRSSSTAPSCRWSAASWTASAPAWSARRAAASSRSLSRSRGPRPPTRGTAVSVLSAASMAGLSFLVPITMWCILTFGWRASYVILGVGSLLITLPLSLWILRDDPADVGLHPDGVAPEPLAEGMAPALERTTVAAALQVPAFWQLAGGLFNCGFSMSLLSAPGVPMLTDHGFHAMTASSAMGFLGLTSIGGGMALGGISDRWGRTLGLASVYLLRAGG